jgi:2-dehydro-3-deoxygalactonokinase
MTKTGAIADIVLADWGTSSLRLWALDRQGRLLDERRSDSGMGTLSCDDYAPELQFHLAAMSVPDETPVLICGMAGAAQGWQEAPYLEAPTNFAALADGAITIAGQARVGQMRVGPARDIRILPGIAQRDSANPDVMRGEETILHGLVCNGVRDGTVCLPGTHSKWAEIDGGRLVGFRTMMTGEMFALLGERSILRHTVVSDRWSDDDFIAAVREAHADPSRALAGLFGLRAGPLLFGDAVPHGASRLSGLMIGAEIACCLQDDGRPLHLAATGEVAAHYARALTGLAIGFDMVDAELAVRTGLFDIASILWPDIIPARMQGGTTA